MLEKLADNTTAPPPNKPSFRLTTNDAPPDNKFLSRILSRETALSTAEPSFRVYYGSRSGSVPFFWESEPGTPKHALHEINAPPLTPPPAYSYSNSSGCSPTGKKLRSRSNFLKMLFLKATSPKSPSSRTTSMFFKSKSTGPADTWSSCESLEDSSCSSVESKEDIDQDSVKSLAPPSPLLCFGARRSTSHARS